MALSMLDRAKPYLFTILLQVCSAVVTIVAKLAIDNGMNSSVLVVYRHAFATAMLAPFALVLEWKTRPKITFRVFCHIFSLGLVGIAVNYNLYYIGLKLITSTLATALSSLLPAMTFVIALMLRVESVNLRQTRSVAKVLGTLVCVGGAMLMTLYDGPMVFHSNNHHASTQTSNGDSSQWLKGSLLVTISTLAWAFLFIQQSAALKIYPAELTLTTLMCLVGTIQSSVFALIVEPHPSKWALGWDIKLLACIVTALVGSALPYYLQGVCMRMKGPVFVTSFVPLYLILVAIMGSIFLKEILYLGCVLGGVLIIIGLYVVLWGKSEKISSDNDEDIELHDVGKLLDP